MNVFGIVSAMQRAGFKWHPGPDRWELRVGNACLTVASEGPAGPVELSWWCSEPDDGNPDTTIHFASWDDFLGC